MKYKIEEAIIIETIETEPHFKVETVVPERLDKKPSRTKSFSIFDGLFDLFFGESSLFGLLNQDDEVDLYEEYNEERKAYLEPEPAIIIETHERTVHEQYFFVYEIVE